MHIQSNDIIQEMRKEKNHDQSKHNNDLDNQLYIQFNELKKGIQQLQKENVEIESRLKHLPDFIFDCLEQLGVTLDKDIKVLKEKIIMNSKE